MSQSDVANLAGISRQAVGLLEANAGRISTLLAAQSHAPIRLRGLPEAKTFGERVRAARGSRSIDEVAALASISPNTVRALEKDTGTVRCLWKLIHALAPEASVAPVFERGRGFKTVGGRGNPNRSKHDYYATPAPIVRVLLEHERFEGSILEPCVGEARVIERVLNEHGYEDVTCFDLAGEGKERRDFFTISENYETVLTNPPFNQHVTFILHAKTIAKSKIALLLPLNYLTGKQRHAELWDDRSFPLARVLVLNRGVNFLVDDPFAEYVQPSQLYLAWFIFERSHDGPPVLSWIDSHALIQRKPTQTDTAVARNENLMQPNEAQGS